MTPNAPGPLHLTDDDLVYLLDGAPMAVVILRPDLRVPGLRRRQALHPASGSGPQQI